MTDVSTRVILPNSAVTGKFPRDAVSGAAAEGSGEIHLKLQAEIADDLEPVSSALEDLLGDPAPSFGVRVHRDKSDTGNQTTTNASDNPD